MNIRLTPSAPSKPLPTLNPKATPEQTTIREWPMTSQSRYLLIDSCAGSGKSTTLLDFCTFINLNFPESNVVFLSFNSSIFEEISAKMEAKRIRNTLVSTLHSLGNKLLNSTFGRCDNKKRKKMQDICASIIPKSHYPLLKSLADFCGLYKSLGADLYGLNPYALLETYNVRLASGEVSFTKDKFIQLTLQAIELSNEQFEKERIIDFDDMIYLPLRLNLSFPTYPFVIIDEFQDINPTRLDFALRCLASNGRLIVAGDKPQSIYGFTGADTQAFEKFKQIYSPDILPLSYTFRCAKAIVAYARKRTGVSHINPLPDAPEGSIRACSLPDFLKNASSLTPGQDAILCRNNAPILSLAFKLHNLSIPVRIEGRDIGEQLIYFCKNFSPSSISDLSSKLLAHLQKESTRLHPGALEVLSDKIQSIQEIIQNLPPDATIASLERCIRSLFSDSDKANPNATRKITLSSIHKAKGLEWHTVYHLDPSLIPSKHAKTPEQLQQETNLLYVCITRAAHTYVELNP